MWHDVNKKVEKDDILYDFTLQTSVTDLKENLKFFLCKKNITKSTICLNYSKVLLRRIPVEVIICWTVEIIVTVA